MKKYRLEIPEMVPSNIAGLIARLNDFIQKGTSILTYDQADKIGVSYDHKIIGTYAVPVYFCDECGEEMRGDTVDADRHYHTECLNLEEPEFPEVTAEEWQKENAKRIKDQVVDDRRYIDIGDTAYYKAALMGIEVGIAEGIRRNEWKHRERQTFEEYCDSRKLGWSITPLEAWFARDKSRGF